VQAKVVRDALRSTGGHQAAAMKLVMKSYRERSMDDIAVVVVLLNMKVPEAAAADDGVSATLTDVSCEQPSQLTSVSTPPASLLAAADASGPINAVVSPTATACSAMDSASLCVESCKDSTPAPAALGAEKLSACLHNESHEDEATDFPPKPADAVVAVSTSISHSDVNTTLVAEEHAKPATPSAISADGSDTAHCGATLRTPPAALDSIDVQTHLSGAAVQEADERSVPDIAAAGSCTGSVTNVDEHAQDHLVNDNVSLQKPKRFAKLSRAWTGVKSAVRRRFACCMAPTCVQD
jgi:hypothetical protein